MRAWLVRIGILLSLLTGVGNSEEVSDQLSAINKLGGTVTPSKVGNGSDVEFHLRGRDLTDSGLAEVVGMRGIVKLNLRDTQITGAGLEHLKGLTELRRLHLERTQVGDEGIAHLKDLKSLEYLNLYGTRITDKALEHLEQLENLEQLYVWQTDVTDEGIARLQKAIPKLRIERGVDLALVDLSEKKAEPEPKVALKWIPAGGEDPPKSVSGDFITVTFENKRSRAVKLFWVQYDGGLRHYADIAAGAKRLQTTYSGATWVITNESEVQLGYFRTGADVAFAIIPE